MLLSVNRISKSFEDRAVLSDVSFDIGEGEIVGFLGPNGAGKTTAIKIILGLLTPNAGEVYIDGLNVRTDFEKAIRNVGAIIETPELYGYLSGMDNLKVAARPYRVHRSRINEVVETVGLSEQIGEGMSWITGSYEVLNTQTGQQVVPEKSLEDLVAARGIEPDQFCLNESCHNMTRDDLIQATADLERNPHVAQHGENQCSDCHKAHRASVNMCSQCHNDAPIPEGWISAADNTALEKELDSLNKA